jgi:CheY-like chemotaxis protein
MSATTMSRHTPRFTVALEGFSTFERSALASYFRLAAQRVPAYHQVESIAFADFVVADTTHPGAVDAVVAAGRVADAVFVGDHPPSGAIACLPRPIDPMQIERALDALAGTRHALASEPVGGRDVDLLLADLGERAAARPAGKTGGGGRLVLVVDDSGIARKFLALRLARLGYVARTARSAEEAQVWLARERFAIVFADVVLGDEDSTDGLTLCRQVKQRLGGASPGVVIVSGHASPPDRVRGSLAGCDAYLGKPLSEDELLAALRSVDPAFTLA